MNKPYRKINNVIKSEINIIPLLDILLVVLLIFIITTPVINQNIKVHLPNIDRSFITDNDNSPVIIEISGIGHYSMIIGNNRIDSMLPEQILSKVQYWLKLNPKTVFLIGGAKEIPYSEIIKILNLLYSINVKLIGLMINPI